MHNFVFLEFFSLDEYFKCAKIPFVMGRPLLQPGEKLIPVPIRLLPETLTQVEKVAGTRDWSTAQTIRKMVEAALRENLVPPVKAPQAEQGDINLQSLE